MKLQDFWTLLKTTFKEWNEDKAPRLAAALAYYTIFSLAPILVIAIAIAGWVFGEEAAQNQIVGQIEGLIGRSGAELVQQMILAASQPEASIPATIIGIALLLFGASGLFGQLQEALNTIWDVRPKAGGALNMIKKRFFSFTMVLGVGFLLLVSLVISAGLSALGNFVADMLPGLEFLMQVLNLIVSFGVITLLFALIFKILPDVEIAWKDVWLGAAVTSVLFNLGKFLIGLYLGTSSVGSAYGAAGSLVILLLWIYYSGQILFFGAEFTQVYANMFGKGVVPEEGAEMIPGTERAEQGIAPEGAGPQRQSQGQTAPISQARLSALPETGRNALKDFEPERQVTPQIVPPQQADKGIRALGVLSASLVAFASSMLLMKMKR